PQIDARDRTAGAARLEAVLVEAEHDARQVEPLLEARGGKTQYARMPALAGDDDGRARPPGAKSGLGLAQRLVEHGKLDRLALAIELLELIGDDRAAPAVLAH